MSNATKYTDNISIPLLLNAYRVALFSDIKPVINKYQTVNLGIAGNVYERFAGWHPTGTHRYYKRIGPRKILGP